MRKGTPPKTYLSVQSQYNDCYYLYKDIENNTTKNCHGIRFCINSEKLSRTYDLSSVTKYTPFKLFSHNDEKTEKVIINSQSNLFRPKYCQASTKTGIDFIGSQISPRQPLFSNSTPTSIVVGYYLLQSGVISGFFELVGL